MTDNTVDLDAKRKAKAPKCEICGQLEHDDGLCPRIESVEHFMADGTSVRYYLRLFDDDVAGE
jgi:hypothetical protein